jgi:dipeptidyl aminopeptidase/acylaminoacyl peptidase
MRLKHLLLASSLAVAAGLAMPAFAVDVDQFIRRDKFNEIKISPNGDYLAATVPLEDRTVLAIIRRSDNKVTANFSVGQHNHVADFVWVNPERVVISMAEKFGSLDKPQLTGELFAINADGSRAENLVGYRVQGEGLGTKIQPKKVEAVAAFLVDDLPADDKSVIISVTPFAADTFSRAEKLDVYSGRRVRVAGAPVRNASFFTDNAGVVRFAHGTGTDLVNKLYYREGDGADWRLINDEDQSRRIETPIGFSADNAVAYLQVEHETGPDAIVAFDIAGGKRTETFRDSTVDPGGIVYKPNTGVPVGVFLANGRWSSRFFDPSAPEARLQKSLEAAFPESSVTVTSQTQDGRVALVRVSSDRNPGDYYLFDTVGKKAEFLLASRDWLDPEAMHPVTPVAFKARDGLQLHGYLTRPRGSAAGRLPMVILSHGGPYGVRDYWRFDDDAQLLASAGYAVLQVNFRGSGGYGRAFHHAGGRQWGKAMQDDITDATRWAVAEGHADGSKICLYGASYGAYTSLMGVAKEPDLYRCAAGYVGAYDLPTMHTDGDIRESQSGKTYLEQWIGPRSELAAVSPNRIADRIKVPVFMAAGGEDRRTPIQHTKMMEQALLKAGVPVETLYYDTEGHGFYKPQNRREYYTRLLAFFARNLGGKSATAPSPTASK